MNYMIKKHRTCSKVNTFAELSQFGRLAEEWCIAYGEDIFDLYTGGGRKTLFVIQTDDALSVTSFRRIMIITILVVRLSRIAERMKVRTAIRHWR